MAKDVITLGGLPITVASCDSAARDMVDEALARRSPDRDEGQAPKYITSANGQVLSMCATDAEIKALFEEADIIHADGEPMVKLSRLLCHTGLPERVATTDLVHNAAKLALEENISFYFLGASQEVIETARANMEKLYPGLVFAGARNGYISEEEEDTVIEEINAAKPDILWIGMGVPLEQKFISRNKNRLTGVGVIKTCGGLFDFLSGKNKRAAPWMQKLGLEWAYRTWLEPRRLAWRYLTTNPHALLLLLTRSH
ncbi:MAG: WecB/TagA/CpsF family glycosyltransferase [Cohaesibacter sp.]|nr:WecB/TagA/CpsF family glycosyltransferase [Cohaesibacter sp.]